MGLFRLVAVLALNALIAAGVSAEGLDPSLPAYKPVGELSGRIHSVGSDTMSGLMKHWSEGFKQLYPNVTIEIESQGSATAPAALLEGTSQLGPMSRPMDGGEVEAFHNKYGYPPASFPVAVDALAVYVNKDNPIECLTLPQLNQIFNNDHWNAGGVDIKTWGDAGLSGEWASRPISLFGRNALSGTFEIFKDTVLLHGNFKNTLKQEPDSLTVVQMVAGDKFGIGYSGIGYLSDGVRAVALAQPSSGQCYQPTAEYANSGQYPLSRYLRLYLNRNPKQPLDPAMTEYVKYVLSKDGQTITMKEGFYPIGNALRAHSLQKLGISTDTK